MRNLTQSDWNILRSFDGPLLDREQIFVSLQLRADFNEIRILLMNTESDIDPANSFHTILNRFPHSLSCEEHEEIYRIFLLEDWHHEHDNMIGAFQNYFNKTPGNVEVLLNRIYRLPEFYRHDKDLRNPFIRKGIYAIAAQPEPFNIEALTEASKSDDEAIRSYALHQLEKGK